MERLTILVAMSTAVVLVLSPLAENRERIHKWLAPLGRDCLLLSDTEALWDALGAHRLSPPALLVFDGHPAEDSYSLINRLQGDTAGAQLPILLLTDNLADSSRRFYSDLLFTVECLPKPVSEERLLAVAAACLGLDDARRALEAEFSGDAGGHTLSEGLLAFDESGKLSYANSVAARWLKLSPLALCQLNVISLLEAPVRQVDSTWSSSSLAQAMEEGKALEVLRLPLWRGDGSVLVVQAALMPFQQSCPWLLAFKPADAQSGVSAGFAELARVDRLTGLPTRAHMEEAMTPLLVEGQRPALLLLDIDHLRHVNETLGYDFGDQLLKAAATRLRGGREAGLLASMGGGRFALLADDVADYRVAGRIAQRLQSQFRLPFLLAGHEVFCSVSIGIALYPLSGDDSTLIVQGAERALERAKAVGRNVIQFDSAELNHFSIERLELETAFHQAIQEGGLSLAWRVWRKADAGLVAIQPRVIWPDAPKGAPDPVALAEDCGLSRELSDWMFRQAVASPELLADIPASVSLAFTVSTPQILDPFVVPRLRAWLSRHGIRPERVQLLIPWREDEAAVLMRLVPELLDEGVRLALYLNAPGSALDAFAAGPWRTVVLGRDYLQRLSPGRAQEVLGAMAGFGHRLGLRVFCEGLPDGMTAAQAWAAGIDVCSEDVDELPPLNPS